jgi:hypothetical protein
MQIPYFAFCIEYFAFCIFLIYGDYYRIANG